MTQPLNAFGEMLQHAEELYPCVAWLKSRGPLRRVMEIGAYNGASTAYWCSLCDEQMVSVDLPDGRFGGINFLEATARNRELRRRYPHFEGVLGDAHLLDTALRASRTLTGELDVLMIDGDHTYEGVSADYHLYGNLVRSGGVILFHDVSDTPYHRQLGVDVPRFWCELTGDKREFILADAAWGGIGALIV